jgi:hypothetical protein
MKYNLAKGKKTGDWNHQLVYQEQLHNANKNDGKKKKRWKPFPHLQKYNLIQDSEGNEENGYPALTPAKQR